MRGIQAENLQSSSHYTVANSLSDALIAEVAARPDMGGCAVADALQRVRDAVWSPLSKGAIAFAEADEQKRSAIYAEVLASLDDDAKRCNFLEAYARLGNLYEIASLVARENVINRELDGYAPGGVREFVTSCDTAQRAADALSKPVFEMVMTAHPTNVNALDSIKAQRALGQAIDALREGKTTDDSVDAALREYLETPLLQGDSEEIENLTVQDETEFTLYYLCNVYDDLPVVYAAVDEAIRRKGNYDPLSLSLQLRFGSWGSSGDKDGNMKVTADTTLDAIARHKCAILDRYTTSLRAMNEPLLAAWLEQIDAARQRTADLQRRIIDATGQDGIAPQEFDALSHELASCVLDAKGFEAAAIEAYHATGRQEVLELVRRIRIFGAAFAKIEYRENAEEYTRVVAQLVPDYAQQSLDTRVETLTNLLADPAKAAALYAAQRDALAKAGMGKPYSDSDAAPITYQTLRRMELARDFPNIIRDNVLAEFTHPSQLLEAVLLQAMVLQGGKRAELGIVPLFESPESMQQAPDIMRGAYANAAYRAHMECVAARDGLARPVQQIQIAHSDNARRSGLPAARAFIHAAHRALRTAAEENGVDIQFFEGGSSSDIYRGGLRATSAAVRAYGLHDFAKFTFQGGDMLNYLNYSSSTKRLFVRNFAHSAAFHLHGYELASTTEWRSGVTTPRLAYRDRHMTELADGIVCDALQGTLEDYREHSFTRAGLGHLLRELEYDEEKLAGAAGSRAPARGGDQKKTEEPPKVNVVPLTYGGRVAFGRVSATLVAPSRGVDIHKTRTITFSEALQHGGLVPTIVGSRTIYKNLRREVNALRAALAQKEQAGEELERGERELVNCYHPHAAADAQLPAAAIRFLFRQSRLLRDVVIRLAIGVALTDFDAMRAYHPRLRQDPFLEQLEVECREAANIVCAAFTGKYPEALIAGGAQGRIGFDAISTNRLRHLMVARFPEMQQVLEDKSRYLGFLQAFKADARERAKQSGEGMDAYSRRLAHAAGDTVTHGRMVPTDDPAYGRYLRHKLRLVLEQGGSVADAVQTA